MNEIQQLTRRIAEEFNPKRVILFGSYAYGRPRKDSDVDLLVEMRYTGNALRQSARILRRIRPRCALDILVISPSEIRSRLREDDWFIADIIEKGRLLYEKRHK
ncbi:MAG TPA: nucleotidyltransferase domain-containing protein [Phycisphaerae bacterium]|jgi:predicted nucleotidyltransferase